MFASDAGLVLNFIKPDKTADFESVVGKLKEAVKQALLKPSAPAPTEVPEPETEEKE